MTPDHLVLERFDDTAAATRTGHPPNKLEDLLAQPTPTAEEAPSPIPEEVAAPPEVSEEPTPAPEEDHAAEMARQLAAIQGNLSALVEGEARLRMELLGQWAVAFGKAAADILPTLARRSFAGEVAQAALRIASTAGHPQIEIALPPDATDQVRTMLLEAGLDISVELVPDSDLAPGRAEMRWAGGGADFDSGRLLEAALDLLQQRFPVSETKGVGNDE